MNPKQIIKKNIAALVYSLYEHHILKEHIHVESIDETIRIMEETEDSLVRYGDGEITVIRGRTNATQSSSGDLGVRLAQILEDVTPGLQVTLQDIWDGLDMYRPESKNFWLDHILMSRSTYHKYCNLNRTYYNTGFSRTYMSYKDKSHAGEQFERIRHIWEGRNVIVVEGVSSHNGVGNNLLDTATSIRRIIGPPKDAYSRYDDILNACLDVAKHMPKDTTAPLFLLAIGAAAKPLAYDLHMAGYRVIDIGNLDLEYEWYLMQAKEKTRLTKHEIIGEDANRKAGYTEYLNQVVKYV